MKQRPVAKTQAKETTRRVKQLGVGTLKLQKHNNNKGKK